jgi:hypothetical protein
MSNCSTKRIYTGGRVVGEVVGEVFRKKISGSRHILHKPRAIALSVESLTQAEKVGAREIQINDKETGRVYSCSVEDFKEKSFPIQRGGFEPQMALTLDRFDVTSPLDYSSRATKQGEVRHEPGNGKRTRNPRGVKLESPRQMLFKGMG